MDINIQDKNSSKPLKDGQDANRQMPEASRKSLQLPRRLFHMSMGIAAASIYYAFLSHKQAVYILGFTGSLIYLLEQIRINYPELSTKVPGLNKYFLRAEEAIRESAAIPYNMAMLLTIITFPKSVALSAIYTLAIADPISALVGIRFGKRRIVKNKSIEGSLAFFVCTVFSVFIVFLPQFAEIPWTIFGMALGVGMFVASFEMIPLKLDDNLTIPLFTAITIWIVCAILDIPI